MAWLWFKSQRRGEKAHFFRDGSDRSYCGVVERSKTLGEVDPNTVRKCVFCWDGRMCPGAPSPS